MQCPKCRYEPTMSEISASPGDCVKCGINYIGHANAVSEARAQRQAAAVTPAIGTVVKKALAGYEGAQAVVVLDLQMSFNSMVWFMVKWVLASIPALIVLAVIVFIAATASGVVGGLFAHRW